MNMIYYEALKLLRSKAVLFALGFLLLLNGVCVLYSAEHASEEGYSPAEAAGVAEEWSGMSLEEAIAYIISELETYSVNVSSGESISEADFVRGTILSSELSRLTELSQYNEYREGIQASAEAMTRTGLLSARGWSGRKTAMCGTCTAAARTQQVRENRSWRSRSIPSSGRGRTLTGGFSPALKQRAVSFPGGGPGRS